ncbi:hypothetical protein [Frateuria aurantia]|uniref:hypothetical protein n=1 Tax=Frateuria aurantia TaxID=81475 RepID=UPI00059D9278|nr:hypothetical protein [Frateuria aurantia]
MSIATIIAVLNGIWTLGKNLIGAFKKKPAGQGAEDAATQAVAATNTESSETASIARQSIASVQESANAARTENDHLAADAASAGSVQDADQVVQRAIAAANAKLNPGSDHQADRPV